MSQTLKTLPSLRYSPAPGVVIPPRYVLRQRLAEGGAAEVWLAQDTDLQGRVVIKLQRRDLAAQGTIHMEREREALQRLQGIPQIVRLLGNGRWGGLHYLVLEYNAGMLLADWIDSGRGQRPPAVHAGPRADALPLIQQLCGTVAAMHRRGDGGGITHNDINPSNIMIHEQQVTLLDFGLAHLQNGPDLTRAGHFGTHGYMPPEQGAGATHLMGPSSDVFSLAIVVTELLTLRRTGPGERRWDLFAAHQHHDLFRYLCSLPLAVHASVWSVLSTAMHPNPRQRFPDATPFRDALIGCLLPIQLQLEQAS